LIKKEVVGGGKLSSGVMVETKDLGMLHYAVEDADILCDAAREQLL